MGLEHIVDALRADVAAVAPVEFGARELATFNTPPRYVWVPNSSSYEAPYVVGGSPRAIYDQVTDSSVYCWGETDVDARILERVLLVALRKRFGATMQPLSTEYGKPDWLTMGYMAIVRVKTRVPVCDITWPETIVLREESRAERIALETASETVSYIAAAIAKEVAKWPDPTTPEAQTAIRSAIHAVSPTLSASIVATLANTVAIAPWVEAAKWPDPTIPEAQAAILAVVQAAETTIAATIATAITIAPWSAFVFDATAPTVNFKYVAIAQSTPDPGNLTGQE